MVGDRHLEHDRLWPTSSLPTALGRLVASGTIVAGLVMIALPVGIVATAFSEVIHRRDFIITWSMVARVPPFARLTAGNIAHIANCSAPRQVDRWRDHLSAAVNLRTSMYFVTEGEVEIEVGSDHKKQRIRLAAGHFFGERAILREETRSSTATSIGRTRLLVLDATDFRALIAQEVTIARHVDDVIKRRMARGADEVDPTFEEAASGDAG